MKKCDVDKFKMGTPERVVAHAAWQRSRGRQPSMFFMNEANPRKALALAIQTILRDAWSWGRKITAVAEFMVLITKATGRSCTTMINDIELFAKPGDSPDHIVKIYRAKREADIR